MDIDRNPFGDARRGFEEGFGRPINEAAGVEQVRRLLTDDGIWTQDDMLREGTFTKLLSFATREGVAYQLYLQDQRFVLARFSDLNSRGFEFVALPDWATQYPRWVVQGLVEYGLSTWGV